MNGEKVLRNGGGYIKAKKNNPNAIVPDEYSERVSRNVRSGQMYEIKFDYANSGIIYACEITKAQ